jgi:hypothetical protein
MRFVAAAVISVLALGCTREGAPVGQGLGDVPQDGGAGSTDGTLCDPSWTAPLRLSTGTEDVVGAMNVTLSPSSLRFELDASEGAAIGDVYVGVGVFPNLRWFSGNLQPWITGWQDVVVVEAPADAALGPCGGELKIIVQARAKVGGAIRFITAQGSGDLGPYGSYDMRPLCCDAEPIDADGDGSPEGEDCDDTDPSVSPDAEEIPYDEVDQDCDGADEVAITAHALTADGFGPESASLADGTSFVLWRSASFMLQGRLVGPDGQPAGPIVDFQLDFGALGGAVATDGSRFLVVSSGVTGWFVEADGTVGAPFEIFSGGAEVSAGYANGSYLVAYRILDNPIDESINATVVSAAGVVGASFDVSTTLRVFALEVESDGTRFLVTFVAPGGSAPSTSQTYNTNDDVLGRIVDPATGALGAEIPIATQDGVFGLPSVASAGGEYLVVYRVGSIANLDGDLYARRLASDGALIGGELTISTAPGSQYHPNVVAVAGGYAVLWADSRYAAPFTEDHRAIFAQVLSSDGTPSGAEQLIAAQAAQSYAWLHASAYGASSALTSWQDGAGIAAASIAF